MRQHQEQFPPTEAALLFIPPPFCSAPSRRRYSLSSSAHAKRSPRLHDSAQNTPNSAPRAICTPTVSQNKSVFATKSCTFFKNSSAFGVKQWSFFRLRPIPIPNTPPSCACPAILNRKKRVCRCFSGTKRGKNTTGKRFFGAKICSFEFSS